MQGWSGDSSLTVSSLYPYLKEGVKEFSWESLYNWELSPFLLFVQWKKIFLLQWWSYFKNLASWSLRVGFRNQSWTCWKKCECCVELQRCLEMSDSYFQPPHPTCWVITGIWMPRALWKENLRQGWFILFLETPLSWFSVWQYLVEFLQVHSITVALPKWLPLSSSRLDNCAIACHHVSRGAVPRFL